MGLIGTIISRMTNTQILAGLMAFSFLVGAVGFGALEQARKENEIPCLSCLALDPVAGDFSGEWWVKYPSEFLKEGQTVDHPSWVRQSLLSYEVVVIFFWQVACEGCEEQWADMLDYGLVQGGEQGGSMDKYSDRVELYSLDVHTAQGLEGFDAYARFRGQQGTPTTVFLTRLRSGDIGWYSQLGAMPAEDVEIIIQIGLQA